MNNLLILTKISKPDYELFKTVSNENKIFDYVEVARFNDVDFDLNSENLEVTINGRHLSEFNIIYVRSLFNSDEELIELISRYAKKRDIRIVDKIRSIQESRMNSKIVAYSKLKDANLPIIESYFTTKEQLTNVVNKSNLVFPFILKSSDDARGNNVFLIKTETDIVGAFEKSNKNRLIAQPFIENKGDIRVIVVGEKALGAMQRYNPEDFRNNVSAGGEVEQVELTAEMEEVSIKAAEVLNIEIAGVDLIFNKTTDRWEIMEVNIAPQFGGFKTATKLDVEKEILNYLKNS